MAGKKSGQTNRRGRTHQDHRSKKFLYELKAALRAAVDRRGMYAVAGHRA
jgi:hypothetical protein